MIGFSMHAGTARKPTYLLDALAEFGYIPELLNRLTAILFVPSPTAASIRKIVIGEHGILSSFNALLAGQGVAVGLSQEAAELVAGWCIETKSYARGAKMLVSRLVEELVFADTAGFRLFSVDDARRAIEQMSSDSTGHDDEMHRST